MAQRQRGGGSRQGARQEAGKGGEQLWLLPFALLVLGGVVTAFVLAGAGQPPRPGAPLPTEATPPPEEVETGPRTPSPSPTVDERTAVFGPVHAMTRWDAGLLLATEDGLWHLGDDGAATRAGGPRHRFSALTRRGASALFASGLSEEGEPLGLVESSDGGASWRSVALVGQAAFKRIETRGGRIFAWDVGSGRLLVSPDGREWEEATTEQGVLDFAVSGGDASRMVRAVPEGGVGLPEVQESRDGGRTWERIAAPSLFLFDWSDGDRLWGLTEDGTVFLSRDAGHSWSPRGILPAPPTAFLSTTEVLFAALRDVGVYRSLDQGETWERIDAP